MKLVGDDIVSQSNEEILSELESSLKAEYGPNFYTKAGGIMDSIINMLVESELNNQKVLEFIIKQFNPETAAAFWQDALYERMGVIRQGEELMLFTKTVQGTPNSKISANTVLIRSELTNLEFTNVSEFVVGTNGLADVDFVSLRKNDINPAPEERFRIVKAPVAIAAIVDTPMKNFKNGKLKESNERYKARFRCSKAIKSKATPKANLSSLSRYVDDAAYLNIVDKNNDSSLNSGEVQICVKHNTTDKIFANAIMDTFGCGISMLGSTTVPVKDIKGKTVNVKFTNAVNVPVAVNLRVNLADDESEETVINRIKEAILSFVSNKIYGLGCSIYATELIAFSLKNISGIEAVKSIGIKRQGDSGEYVSQIVMNINEFPTFDYDDINIISEAS